MLQREMWSCAYCPVTCGNWWRQCYMAPTIAALKCVHGFLLFLRNFRSLLIQFQSRQNHNSTCYRQVIIQDRIFFLFALNYDSNDLYTQSISMDSFERDYNASQLVILYWFHAPPGPNSTTMIH